MDLPDIALAAGLNPKPMPFYDSDEAAEVLKRSAAVLGDVAPVFLHATAEYMLDNELALNEEGVREDDDAFMLANTQALLLQVSVLTETLDAMTRVLEQEGISLSLMAPEDVQSHTPAPDHTPDVGMDDTPNFN